MPLLPVKFRDPCSLVQMHDIQAHERRQFFGMSSIYYCQVQMTCFTGTTQGAKCQVGGDCENM